MAGSKPLGITLAQKTCPSPCNRNITYKGFILILTFFCYTSYHLSRKPISVVKPVLHNSSCDDVTTTTTIPTTTSNVTTPSLPSIAISTDVILPNGTTIVVTTLSPSGSSDGGNVKKVHSGRHRREGSNECGWPPFDGSNYEALLGSLDYAFLFAYAIGMFISGHIAERMNLRYFLTIGMLGSGLFTALFGFGYIWKIHSIGYFIAIQIIAGFFQATGWPSVVTCVSNWFGKGRRGFIMGVWNSHTSVGNILGSVIAGSFVGYNWGLSFIVPGIIIGSLGIIVFLFLVPEPNDVGCDDPNHPSAQVSSINPVLMSAATSPSTSGSSEGQPLLRSHNDSNDSLASMDSQDRQIVQHSDHTVVAVDPSHPHTNSTQSIAPENRQAIKFCTALKIPGVIEFSLCLFFAKLVSYTFLFWLPEYIHHSTPYDATQAADLSTVFDFGGIAGGILAGAVSDYLGGARAMVCSVMLLAAAPMMFFYQTFGNTSLAMNIVMLLLVGSLVNGPYALITTAVSADLGTHSSLQGNAKALSTVTAIIDGTGSIGAALGPLFTGLIANTSGPSWGKVFYMLIAADICALLLLSRLVYREFRRLRAEAS